MERREDYKLDSASGIQLIIIFSNCSGYMAVAFHLSAPPQCGYLCMTLSNAGFKDVIYKID